MVPARGRTPHALRGNVNVGAVNIPAAVTAAPVTPSKALMLPSVWTKCSMPMMTCVFACHPLPRTTIWLPAAALAVLSMIRAPIELDFADAGAPEVTAALQVWGAGGVDARMGGVTPA